MLVLVLAFAAPALAEDLDDGHCVQSDGQVGVSNGSTADNEGCITAEEYQDIYSVANLLEDGVIASPDEVITEPLDRIVSSNPDWEPDAPTVRHVLFSRFHPI